MFSDEARCIYRENQLADVICQLRFPEILSISTTVPAEFQEAIREDFPLFSQRKEVPGIPGGQPQPKPAGAINYQFSSADRVWRMNLTSKFISLSCSQYSCWEDFARMLDKPLAAFIRIYKPAFFERVGLRYLNFISRFQLGLEGIPFRDLFAPCYLGLLAEEDVAESGITRSTMDVDTAIRGGCRVKIHAGPGMVQRGTKPDPELKFIFDQDLYMSGQLPVNLSAGALQTLHAQAYPIFRGAITDKLHNAMDPEQI